MQLLETETGSSGLYRAVEEYIVSCSVLLLTGTVLSQNPGIPVSRGNTSSCVQAAGNDSTAFSPPDRRPRSVPSPDVRGLGTLVN